MVFGSFDRTLSLWDTETHSQIGNPFEGRTCAVWCFSFSSDGRRVVWDLRTELLGYGMLTLMNELEKHCRRIRQTFGGCQRARTDVIPCLKKLRKQSFGIVRAGPFCGSRNILSSVLDLLSQQKVLKVNALLITLMKRISMRVISLQQAFI